MSSPALCSLKGAGYAPIPCYVNLQKHHGDYSDEHEKFVYTVLSMGASG
jgi:hypothetical protein